MLPLRLVGINMADEASDTLGGGVKNYLGALGFISALLGGEEMLRVGPTTLSVFLIVVGLPFFISPWVWIWIAKRWGSRDQDKTELQYLANEDSELAWAVQAMTYRSAWAKWYSAQSLTLNNHQP